MRLRAPSQTDVLMRRLLLPASCPLYFRHADPAKLPSAVLFTPELGFALLVERKDALAAIVGVDQLIVSFDLEAIRGADLHLRTVADRFLRLFHRERRIARDRTRRFQRRGDDRTALTQPIHHPPSIGILGRERARAHYDFLCTPLTDGSR